MADLFYPSISTDFLDDIITDTTKNPLVEKVKVGSTTLYVTHNTKALHKRTILLRELKKGQVSFELATALAIKFNFMGELLKWLEENRNWKDGAYVVPH